MAPGPGAFGQPVAPGQPPDLIPPAFTGGPPAQPVFQPVLPPGVPMPVLPPQMVPGPGAFGQVPPRPPASIVADLDVSETSLKRRPERLVPRSTALAFVSLLVLAVAGGGGYMAWKAQQAEPAPELPTEVVEPPPEPPPPEEPVVFEEGPPLGPDLPPVDTKGGKGESGGKTDATKTGTETGGKTGKTGGKTDTGKSSKGGTTKGSTGGTPKKTESGGGDDPYAKRKEKAEGADPGRVLVELEYLSAIDKAIKARNWGQALAYIDQHDRELPGGQLVDKFDERRIRAMCGMGKVAEAKTKAQQILAKRPNSLVKNALAETCK